ncbi:DUF4258 domain-containing protein [Sulfurimonas aquatica]|uniref:DUF4258 domain-containing protein n=1 Tax=Sulfurimonas aquatica TaxID=2672570 RepID=A0A975B187_9BACT|nr:DUF4258 domain-containing protein [Sulfurimonas aquatica]QSZ42377.1 DUF4258 domain-containing protein [Sulfurimonas aquatica]
MQFIYRVHAVERMFQRDIEDVDVEYVIKNGNVIESYTDDKPYPSYLSLEKNGATLVFKNVPALVCDNCGEKYLAGKTSKELLVKAKEIAKSGVEIDIRDYQKVA